MARRYQYFPSFVYTWRLSPTTTKVDPIYLRIVIETDKVLLSFRSSLVSTVFRRAAAESRQRLWSTSLVPNSSGKVVSSSFQSFINPGNFWRLPRLEKNIQGAPLREIYISPPVIPSVCKLPISISLVPYWDRLAKSSAEILKMRKELQWKWWKC